MEGGERVDAKTQRDQWRANLAHLRCTNFDIEISEIPSLVELEQACRQVAAGKASGMDRIPSELLRYRPKSMAGALYFLDAEGLPPWSGAISPQGRVSGPYLEGEAQQRCLWRIQVHPDFINGGKDPTQGHAHEAGRFVPQLPSCPTTWRP